MRRRSLDNQRLSTIHTNLLPNKGPMMNTKSFCLTVFAVAVALVILLNLEPTWAQTTGGPLDGIASKANDARDQIINVGKAFIGVVAAVLFVLAATGRVAWMWVGMVVVSGAGLQAIQVIQTWLNS